jgi:hypothetical protein
MQNDTIWAIKNVEFLRVIPLVIATATIGFATPAAATGTVAGTTISNTATASYTDAGGNPQSVPSNQIDIIVDELLDVTVATADPGDIVSLPGSTNQILSFTITNTGNGTEAFSLTPNASVGGDQFDPTVTTIVLDSNGNGAYDPGTDTVYIAGTNDPVLLHDAAIKVFVLSTIPGGATDLDKGIVSLTAAAKTGSGAPGTSFPGQGMGGGDAVVGATGADGVDQGRYIVQTATVTFTKSATVLDPFGGTKSVPGSIITYSLVAAVTGTGNLANLSLGDNIPVGTTYQIGTITLQSAPLTDLVDLDAGKFQGGAVTVALGTVAGGQTRTVTFKVKIN